MLNARQKKLRRHQRLLPAYVITVFLNVCAPNAFAISPRLRICSWLLSARIFGRNNAQKLGTSRRTDQFLLNTPNQPKTVIAEYVRQYRILVPVIYPSLQAALQSNRPFIIRSEHPDEYSAAAGIFESYRVSTKMMDDTKGDARDLTIDWKRVGFYYSFPGIFFSRLKLGLDSERTYLQNLVTLSMHQGGLDYALSSGFDPVAFQQRASFSFWQLLGGYNRSMVADSAIKGRYHIVTRFPEAKDLDKRLNYTVIEKGRVLFSYPDILPQSLKEQVTDTVKFYESIRNLSKFDPNHCPVIEFQTVEGQNYFLQYHRTRDFEETKFTLNREPEPGEVEVDFVRGATAPEGVDLEAKVWNFFDEKTIPTHEQAAIEQRDFFGGSFGEIMSRRRFVQFIDYKSLQDFGSDLQGHTPLSKMFNPNISIVLPRERMLPKDQWSKIDKFRFRIISDGKKAFVKILEIVPRSSNK